MVHLADDKSTSFAAQLANRLSVRPERPLRIKLRTLLKGFGYYRRTDDSVKRVRHELNAHGLDAMFSVSEPSSLDDHVLVSFSTRHAALATGHSALRTHDSALGTGHSEPGTQQSSAGSRRYALVPTEGVLSVDTVQAVVDATVVITTDTGTGSGVIVDPSGLVVTAKHVVDDDEHRCLRTVTARLTDGREMPAVVFTADRTLDFALAWLQEPGPFPSARLGDPRHLRFGQTLLAVGCPWELPSTVSRGIVSNPAQLFRGVEYIQTDAALDPGNSGGPVIDESGNVVGISCWIVPDYGAAKFALPIDYVTGDIELALRLGPKACLEGTHCRWCGHHDRVKRTDFCRNCGIRFDDETRS